QSSYGAERLEAACRKANALGIVGQGHLRSMLKAKLEVGWEHFLFGSYSLVVNRLRAFPLLEKLCFGHCFKIKDNEKAKAQKVESKPILWNL
ncbi:MAG: hypothetical protein ACPGD8_09220, partial [Flavobacteriales bacterium]